MCPSLTAKSGVVGNTDEKNAKEFHLRPGELRTMGCVCAPERSAAACNTKIFLMHRRYRELREQSSTRVLRVPFMNAFHAEEERQIKGGTPVCTPFPTNADRQHQVP